MMTEFTPLLSLGGGLLIGLASVLFMAFHGRIAGINGLLGSLVDWSGSSDIATKLAFLIGMLTAPVAILLTTGNMPAIEVPVSNLALVIGGVIVGFGTSMGSGCTSGHGVCGIARFSVRSIVATLCFMATALIIVFITRHMF